MWSPLTLQTLHENGGPKYLKYDHIVSVHDTAITVPQRTGAQLCRNMPLADSHSKENEVKLQQSVRHSDYNVLKKSTKKLLDGAEMDGSFGTLTALCKSDDMR